MKYNNYYSPIENIDFLWLTEYSDSFITEFDLITKERNYIENIDREKMKTFGLIGQGLHLLFDVDTGEFIIKGVRFKATFFDYNENREYSFMNQLKKYNDLIMYKEAESLFCINGKTKDNILGYHIGYKSKIDIFSFKPILHVEYNKPVYFTFRIVSEKDLNGEFRIYKNDNLSLVSKITLDKNKGKEFKWDVK